MQNSQKELWEHTAQFSNTFSIQISTFTQGIIKLENKAQFTSGCLFGGTDVSQIKADTDVTC